MKITFPFIFSALSKQNATFSAISYDAYNFYGYKRMWTEMLNRIK